MQNIFPTESLDGVAVWYWPIMTKTGPGLGARRRQETLAWPKFV
jgi:hypothetical protein